MPSIHRNHLAWLLIVIPHPSLLACPLIMQHLLPHLHLQSSSQNHLPLCAHLINNDGTPLGVFFFLLSLLHSKEISHDSHVKLFNTISIVALHMCDLFSPASPHLSSPSPSCTYWVSIIFHALGAGVATAAATDFLRPTPLIMAYGTNGATTLYLVAAWLATALGFVSCNLLAREMLVTPCSYLLFVHSSPQIISGLLVCVMNFPPPPPHPTPHTHTHHSVYGLIGRPPPELNQFRCMFFIRHFKLSRSRLQSMIRCE